MLQLMSLKNFLTEQEIFLADNLNMKTNKSTFIRSKRQYHLTANIFYICIDIVRTARIK
jgi:hypothetical protein